MQESNTFECKTIFSNKYCFILLVLTMVFLFHIFSLLNCHISHKNIDHIDREIINRHNPKCYDLNRIKLDIEGKKYVMGTIQLYGMCMYNCLSFFNNSFFFISLVFVFCLIYDGFTKYFVYIE